MKKQKLIIVSSIAGYSADHIAHTVCLFTPKKRGVVKKRSCPAGYKLENLNGPGCSWLERTNPSCLFCSAWTYTRRSVFLAAGVASSTCSLKSDYSPICIRTIALVSIMIMHVTYPHISGIIMPNSWMNLWLDDSLKIFQHYCLTIVF